jgi:uncharacterized membrane protein YkvA (DUF1232 family)
MKRLSELSRIFRREIQVYRSVLTDPRTPPRARWLLGAAVAYALSPLDLIPDFIPVLGHLDDAIILPLLVWLAWRSLPPPLLAEHRARFQGEGLIPHTLPNHP